VKTPFFNPKRKTATGTRLQFEITVDQYDTSSRARNSRGKTPFLQSNETKNVATSYARSDHGQVNRANLSTSRPTSLGEPVAARDRAWK
jgi:hypothetical protein